MNSEITSRNNVRVFGKGTQPMMFAHGFGCDQNMWRAIVPAFESDYRIILFDYVGSGKSRLEAYDPVRYGSVEGYAQDILDVCTDLDLKDLVFVGHSVSGITGILAAIQAPGRFSKLVLVGPSPCYINDGEGYIGGFERSDIESLLEMMDKNYLGWANYLAPAIMANQSKPELSQELSDSFCSTDPAIARTFAEATFLSDYRAILQQCPVPSLIMQCSEDIIAPATVGEYLDRTLPMSTLKVLKATGHCPHMSHPEETIQVIREYLSGRSS